MKIGVFCGSFDPIHTGHAMLASYISQWTDLDEVWITVSRLNPFKAGTQPAADVDRFRMTEIVAAECEKIKACGIELQLPLPSYTYKTLNALKDKHPDHEFRLIIGSDNWEKFSEWRNSTEIITDFGVYIYMRPDYPISGDNLPKNVKLIEHVPQSLISSSFIRKALKEDKNVNFFLPKGVLQYIKKNNLYIERK